MNERVYIEHTHAAANIFEHTHKLCKTLVLTYMPVQCTTTCTCLCTHLYKHMLIAAYVFLCVQHLRARPCRTLGATTTLRWQMCNKGKLTLISHADKPYRFAIFVYTQCCSCCFMRCHLFSLQHMQAYVCHSHTQTHTRTHT